MVVTKAVNPRFEEFLFDWNYSTYLLCGGYGSSKSYHVAWKIINKCLQETRKVLVVREVYDTIRESCFDLFCEILIDMGLISIGRRMVQVKVSPMQINFNNGSKIIFKGMDKPEKLKSINGVTIVWLEEASEIKYSGYKELRGRLRHPYLSLHFILSLNPVGMENWVYTHFFKHMDEEGHEVVTVDDEDLYREGTLIHNGVYYHHSTCEDNLFLPVEYMENLEEMKTYDPDLYRVARLGKFGVNGTRVLPQFEVADSHEDVMYLIRGIPDTLHFHGFDFGFEESYNALVDMAVDDRNKILYLYGEYYKNHMTDPQTADELESLGYIDVPIVADSAEPKAITYYQQRGFSMRGCKKYGNSRLANTRKVKRFKKIVCSPKCKNIIRELKTLTYKKDSKGVVIYDEFNIDAHTFSAIWYGLDTYTVADMKYHNNTRRGTEL